MEPYGPVQACNGIALPFSYVFIVVVNTRNQDLRAMSLLSGHIS
jgi:hypothetical protein